MLALLLWTAVGAAQAEAPAKECPNLSPAELRQSVSGAAQSLGAEAQKLSPPDLSKIQPNSVLQSLGEQASHVRELEWREGASALASGAASGVTRGWQGVKEVAPASARCLQRWTGRASNVVQNVPAPNLPEQEVIGAPEQPNPTALPGVELGTEVMNGVRRAVADRVMPVQVGSSLVDTLANTFPTAFRIIKYYVIWLFATSVLATILLLVILARLSYILLFSSGRSRNSKSLE